MTQYVDPKQLRDVLTQYYSDSELHSMCFDLGIDYESLGGRGKSEQALKLVLHAQRTNRLNDIASYVRRTRDFIQLRTASEPFPMLQDASGPNTTATHIYNAPVYQGDGGTMNNSGDNITMGDVDNSGSMAVGRGAQASSSGDTFNMSGNFSGSNVNIKSTLTNVNQSVGNLPQADDDDKAELKRLLAELNDTLQQIPESRADEAETIAEMVKTLIDQAAASKPKPLLN
ncbi:MAG: hypothetical protein KC419_23200, partial [Anaerolineales bacterium]|nr:hypothetical protein [Anaerolineales bacterium]